jgi:hypothetical protein
MGKPHKHAELIKAWADGAEIEWYDSSSREHRWKDCGETFDWLAPVEFRIKPEPKPDYVEYFWATFTGVLNSNSKSEHNLKLIFDGETGKLKSAEVL